MDTGTRQDWAIWLRSQRHFIVNVIVRTTLIFGTIGIVVTFARVASLGHITFNFIYYLATYLVVLLLFLLGRLRADLRAVGFVMAVYAFGALALYSGWLAGGGRVFLVALAAVSSVLLGQRFGWFAMGLSVATYAGFGLAFAMGWTTLQPLPDPTTPGVIIVEGIGFAIAIAMVFASQWLFGRALMAATEATNESRRAWALLSTRASELETANQALQQAHAELEAAYAQVKELNSIKDEFVANVSHELRTPITNMILQQHLLQLKATDEQRKHLEILDRETLRLKTLIESLLLLSRLEQAQAAFTFQEVRLNALVEEYVRDRALLAQQKGLTLEAEACPDPITVSADTNMLGQVLSILLTNALNYTPDGGKVTIRIEARERNGESWGGFSVSDTGPGIPAEEQPHLFTRFFRGQSAHATKASGTGLGLAIAKEIVDRHQGQIEVDSPGISGEGTTFWVWLPPGQHE